MEQVKLLHLYNAHFSGFPCWSFVSETFNQLMNSWNVNLRVIFDLPYGTHSHLVDSLTDGKHARKMIYTRYLKFLKSIATNRRLRIVTETRRSWTGQNIRKILLDTNVTVVPGVTRTHDLSDYRVYETPAEENWRLGLLVSLLEVRDARWSVMFDEESGQLSEDETSAMINDVCTS